MAKEKLEQDVVQEEEVVQTPKTFERRGKLAGLTVGEMSDEQLKRELINSKSVLYKAKKRNAPEATIAFNQKRVDAAEAEKAKRAPAPAETAEEVYEEA